MLKILTDPTTSLTKQYIALMETEDVTLTFADDALAEIAKVWHPSAALCLLLRCDAATSARGNEGRCEECFC